MSGVWAVIEPVKNYLKFPKVWIDNAVFQLHGKLSVIVLMTCSLLITAAQFIGDPIDCIVHSSVVPEGVMDTYCWIHSTFTLPTKIDGELSWAHPGVGPHSPGGDQENIVKHKYYQWVCFTLFLQALFFHLPKLLWKKWEGGKVSGLIPDYLTFSVTDARMPRFPRPSGIVEKEKLEDAVKKMKVYFVSRDDRGREHDKYFFKFFVCEILCFINVISQIYFVDFFLGGVFTTYGSNVIGLSTMDPEERSDPMNEVFPKMAKCTFVKYGPSGTKENIDGLCVLPVNILNEKIYILLWFWFNILAVVTAFHFVWRLATLVSGRMREAVIRGKSRLFAKPNDIAVICTHITLGDWFLLVQLGNNIDSHIYADLIAKMAKEFERTGRRDNNVQFTSV